MAGKKTKKAKAKKPVKKAAPKKAAKGAKTAKAAKAAKPAKKAAAKKPAAKKAPMKAAPKKKPAAKKPAVKQPAVKEADEAVDWLASEDDGGGGDDVVSTTPAFSSGAKPTLRAEILAMARQLYGDRTDEELLALDPNSIDAMDPSMFYELLGEKYGVEADPDNDNFGGFGGPISKLIAFVESRWDGETRKDTPMPPGEWLEEYVHPETSTES